ncbi:MAG: hypothetical protein ACFFDR_01565, partial [Candidatus Thorarchaeota archaeon]
MTNNVVHRVDPHGRDYFWFEGIELDGKEGDDVRVVMTEDNIAISPILIESITEREMEALRRFMM